MKPSLFNTEMVRAILEGHKTETRRVVKPQYGGTLEVHDDLGGIPCLSERCGSLCRGLKPPYRPGDIMYVREAFDVLPVIEEGSVLVGSRRFYYKADGDLRPDGWGGRWTPSIHMPREAARIFLRVTNVKVQRVQDITEEEARKEGSKKMYPHTDPETGETVYAYSEDGTYIAGFMCVWNDCYANPQPVKVKGVIDHYESYPWEDIQETRTYRGKPWYVIGNPWAWVIEFERCEKPEGE